MAPQQFTGSSWNCPGEGWWPDSYVDEIITAGQEQVYKEGGGEKSEKGVFMAQFEGTTSKISDKAEMATLLDGIFRYSMPNCDLNPGYCVSQTRHYYYSYKTEVY
ncbi:hypothetical protein F53441_10388 [Fusarium austroafricanum]|uniref:Uncharacterized protein n=1 Tax=Fusarium austroafricanum TaxID=2364996 RepID=A0A8H4K8V7_9HYPO|nr:hypothetical protein F53441_10388 [Fusarium austroafricanum]